MDVKRIDRHSFSVSFTEDEIILFDRIAIIEDKPTYNFIRWLIFVGLEIYKLTAKEKE